MFKQKGGIIFILLSLLITINFFLLSKENLALSIGKPLVFLSQILSLLGTVLLSQSFVLSTKASFLENWFGGLDKVYKTHRIIGGISFVFLLSHPTLLIINYLPNLKIASSFVLPGNNLAYNFGIFSLWSMVFLLFLTIYVKLPYDIWKKLHQFMGIILLFGAFHVVLIKSDVSSYFPLRIWILSQLSLAFLSVIYIRIIYPRFGPKYHYFIEEFKRLGDILEISLKPVGKAMNFKPGQFVFLKFENQNDPDMHPFSIASDSTGDSIRFSIKIVGDFTLGLKDVRPGSVVRLWGPYGKFHERFFQNQNKNVVCVAGGIGVTPFLGMLSSEVKSQSEREVHLFYCGKNLEELSYHNEISNLSSECEAIKYSPHCTATKGRLSAECILQAVGSLRDRLIFLCGPLMMMRDLKDQFLKLGVRHEDIIYEEFNLK